MGHARFEVIAGTQPGDPRQPGSWHRPAGRPAGDDTSCAWRLLGANNRELGRSAEVFPDRATCLAALDRLLAAGPTAARALSRDLAKGLWSWRLAGDGTALAAVSSRGYARQRECRYALDAFLTALGSASPPGEDPPRPGSALVQVVVVQAGAAFTDPASRVGLPDAGAAPAADTLPAVEQLTGTGAA